MTECAGAAACAVGTAHAAATANAVKTPGLLTTVGLGSHSSAEDVARRFPPPRLGPPTCVALIRDAQGLLSAANTGPNTNDAHFSIMMGPSPHLNGHYTIFGQVVAGWEVRGRWQGQGKWGAAPASERSRLARPSALQHASPPLCSRQRAATCTPRPLVEKRNPDNQPPPPLSPRSIAGLAGERGDECGVKGPARQHRRRHGRRGHRRRRTAAQGQHRARSTPGPADQRHRLQLLGCRVLRREQERPGAVIG